MKIRLQILICTSMLLYLGTACKQSNQIKNQENTIPAYNVLERSIGSSAKKFNLVMVPTEKGNDWFKVTAQNGNVLVEGSSQVALCKGVYKYLKENGMVNVSWEGNSQNIPEQIPNYDSNKIESFVRYRMYLNACAFGYSTVWWDWTRWEKEIDWMAMHGINTPTALMGQEAVWQEVWAMFGIENNELKDYFSGPAFLPWFRMGNINRHGGPLPQSWIVHEQELQKKVMVRMRELGMKPIVPAFSGYVPKIFMEKFPNAKIHRMKVWSGFDATNGTYMLDPKDPLFKEIGKIYLEKYQEIYGDAEFFLADPFNEMEPPVSDENKYEELAEYGKIIYNTISENAPNAIWVMQGWLFGHDSKFWTPEAIKSFLSKIPKDKIIIQNYGEDRYPIWQKLNSFYGYNWQYGYVHNYGATNPVFGDLMFYQDQALKLQNSSKKGSLVGYGAMPEGIENNSVVYEYIYDIPWGAANKSIDEWLSIHLKSRYGKITPVIENAWRELRNSVYNVKYWDLRWKYGAGTYLHNKRPTIEIGQFKSHPGNSDALYAIISAYLNEIDKFDNNELYLYDLVEFSRHLIALKADKYLVLATNAYKNKNKVEGDLNFSICKELLIKLDTLLMANNFSLEKWCKDAISCPGTDGDKELYLKNAKMQVTIWGGSSLNDYASKEWAGLVRDFYLPRWQMFFDKMKSADDNFNEKEVREEIRLWEEKWVSEIEIPKATRQLKKDQYLEIIKSFTSTNK